MISFCLLQNVYLVYCLQINHRYCWSLWLAVFLFQWHSYAGRAGVNHLHIITSSILQFGSNNWHKLKTVEDLKLNLVNIVLALLLFSKFYCSIMRNFQSIIFIWIKTYWEIFKPALVYLFRVLFLSNELKLIGRFSSLH